MADTRITDAEIAGHMGWRGPGAYTEASLRKIRGIVDHVLRAERLAVSEAKGQELRDVFDAAWNQALSDAAFYVEGHCADGAHHVEHIVELAQPKVTVGGLALAYRPAEVDDMRKPPRTPEEMVAFVGNHYNAMLDEKADPADIEYALTVHDLLSAMSNWFEEEE